MSGQTRKTIAYKFGKRWFCGNCGSGVEYVKFPDRISECEWCEWMVIFPQSTGPTTTTRTDNQSLWSREGSPDQWKD